MEYNFDEIKKSVDGWSTIICSLSTANRRGKVKNRIIWVNVANPEKCIKSFLDSLQRENLNKKREKITNYILGKIDIRGLTLMEGKPNMIRVMEYLPTGQIGEVKEFECGEEKIYKLKREYNVFLGTELKEYGN